MPKKRKQPGTREIEKRLLIFCEGAKDKSEDAYLRVFISKRNLPMNLVDIRVIATSKNTGKELVRLAKSFRKKEYKNDSLWVVYDKDGYSKHPQTFDEARTSNINIVFSSISFEFWILLHFEYTTRAFGKSEEIIHYLKHQHGFEYEKGMKDIFHRISDKLDTACLYAERVRSQQQNCNHYSDIYDLNPYTNMDKLINEIKEIEKIYNNQ